MSLRIVCSGYLVRYPLGGFSPHHLQYLVGLRRLGHEVTYFEDYGWESSCYDPAREEMTGDPSYGIAYLRELLEPHGLVESWCYLAEDGTARGMSREELAQRCREADLYLNLSNINWIPEVEACRRRVLIDTDPVFTQIKAHGAGGDWDRYQVLFTYGENIHRAGNEMPTGGARWLPTRQPVVPELWAPEPGSEAAPFTTVMSWNAYGEHEYEGRSYGQKSRTFEPYFDFPTVTGAPMELAIAAPGDIKERLERGGWRLRDPQVVAREPADYRAYISGSRAEFSVAKHGYVAARSGWFSERSTSYLALGRPVVVQDTGFSDFLPNGEGIFAFRTPGEAAAQVRRVTEEYPAQQCAARAVAEEYFHADRVLTRLLEQSL